MNFILWKIILFPLVTAFIVDKEYKPEQDVYDTMLNTFFLAFCQCFRENWEHQKCAVAITG